MLAERPLARDDLDIAPREIDDETVYFVGDPLKNEFKQLDELQYVVFAMLDGTRTLDAVAAELMEGYEVDVEPEDLVEFVEGLGEMDLLDPSSFVGGDAPDPAAGREIIELLRRRGIVYARRATEGLHIPLSGRERREAAEIGAGFDRALSALEKGFLRATAAELRGILKRSPRNYRARYLLREVMMRLVGERQNIESIWFWRIPVVNPDRVLARVNEKLGRLIYNRVFALAYAALMVVCLLLVALDLDRAIADFHYILGFSWLLSDPVALPFLWGLGVISLFGHEGMHGLTCRHYGGRVREMGILVMYLSPTAYCDVSSSYLIEDKTQRILVSMAGLLFNFGLWMIFVLVWALFRTDTTLGVIAFVMVLNGPGYLNNLDPMVRSDGYLALTDLIEYPNLRGDAFEYIRLRAVQLFLGEDVEIPEELHERRKLFFQYAIPGSVGTLSLIVVVLYAFTTTLIEELHTLGVFLSGLLLWFTVGRPLITVAKWTFLNRARLRASRRFRLIAAPVALVLVGLLAMPWPLTMSARCVTHPVVAPLRSPLDGAVAAVEVEDGARVRAGQVLLRLDVSALDVALARARAELKSAELDLRKLKKRARDEELGVAQARLAGERAQLRATERRLARIRRLASSSLVSRDELDRLNSLRARSRSRVAAASGDLRALSEVALAGEVEAAEALIGMLRAQVEDDERRLASTVLRSPADGIVRLGRPIDELLGAVVSEGDPLLRVRQAGGERLELLIPITAPIDLVERGARVTAKLTGAPHRSLTGSLDEVSAAFEGSDRDRSTTESSIRALVTLDDEESVRDLPQGLGGKAEITAGWFPLAWHAYLRVVRLIEVDLNYVITSVS